MDNKKKSKKKIVMNREETLHFIAEVQKHRCLWDRQDENYKDKYERDKAWGQLSITMGYNADDLVKKWSSLRSSMRTVRSILRKQRLSNVGRKPFAKWPFFSAMLFSVDAEAANTESLSNCGTRAEREKYEDIESPIIALPQKIQLPAEDLDEEGDSPLEQQNYEESIIEPITEEITLQPPKKIRLRVEDPHVTGEPSLKQSKQEESVVETRSDEIPTSSTSQEPLILRRIPRPAMFRPVKTVKLIARPRMKEPEFVAVKAESRSRLPSPEPEPSTHSCRVTAAQGEDEMYGHCIALQLKQFPPKTKKKLRIQINELIVKAQKHAFQKQFGVPYDS